jgi:hypothetical protein
MTAPLELGGAPEEVLEGTGSSELVLLGSSVLLELSVLEGSSLLLDSVGRTVAVMVV